MQKASIANRTAVVCPICKRDDYTVNRRRPSSTLGHVEKMCTCGRCGTTFVYVEDRTGRPVRA